jgi:AcrR family transcriptional regulator
MGRPREFNEEDVVAAARDQFWTAGYAGTSLDDLTAVTGLGRGSLYAAFGDKHALFMRALDDYCTSMTDMVVTELRESEDRAYDRLVTHIRSMARSNVADTRRNGCMVAKSASELGATDKPVARRVKKTVDAYQSALVETITLAQQEGDIDDATDSRALAALLLSVLRGMEALRKAGSTPATIAAAGEQAIALLPRTSSNA